MLRTVCVFMCAVVALAWSCCTPDQWEGAEGAIIGYHGPGKHGGLIREYIQVAYDFTNKQSAANLYYFNKGIKAEFKVIVKYDKECQDANCAGGKMYVYNVKDKKCWEKSIKGAFRKACIPEKAKYMGDYYLGLEGGLKASAYEFDGKHFTASISVSSVGKNQCVPIGETIAKQGRYSTLSNVGFLNITTGIKDPSVFDVPAACKETEDMYFPYMEVLAKEDHFFAL